MKYRIVKRTNPNNNNWPYYIPQYSTKFLFWEEWHSYPAYGENMFEAQYKEMYFFVLEEAKKYISSQIELDNRYTEIKKTKIKDEIVWQNK